MAGMPIRRARKAIRDQMIREQAVRDYLGPNGRNLFPNLAAGAQNEPLAPGFAIPATDEGGDAVALPAPSPAPLVALPEKLQEAADLALEDALHTLKLKVDRFDKNYLQIKKLKAQAQQTVISILARTRPSALQGQKTDELAAWLASVKGE